MSGRLTCTRRRHSRSIQCGHVYARREVTSGCGPLLALCAPRVRREEIRRKSRADCLQCHPQRLGSGRVSSERSSRQEGADDGVGQRLQHHRTRQNEVFSNACEVSQSARSIQCLSSTDLSPEHLEDVGQDVADHDM